MSCADLQKKRHLTLETDLIQVYHLNMDPFPTWFSRYQTPFQNFLLQSGFYPSVIEIECVIRSPITESHPQVSLVFCTFFSSSESIRKHVYCPVLYVLLQNHKLCILGAIMSNYNARKELFSIKSRNKLRLEIKHKIRCKCNHQYNFTEQHAWTANGRKIFQVFIYTFLWEKKQIVLDWLGVLIGSITFIMNQ